MSILDTFYILFKTDAEEAAEDIEKVDAASDKAEKGLKDVDKAAGAVGQSFINMAKQLAAPLLALASVGSLVNIAMERAAAVRELDAFSVKVNSSISDVDAFQRSIKGLGGETAGAVDSLVKLGEKVNEAFSDKESGARKDFKEWGLAFKDAKGEALGATDAMLELAKNLEGVSNAEALARIKKLGIEDATTIEALMLGRRTLEAHIEAQKEMGVVTEENAAAVRDYYSALGEAQNLLTSIGNKILSTFLPIATQAIEIFGGVVRWFLQNQKLVEGFFVGIATVLAARYTPAMIRAAWATAAALWPYIALAAAVFAVATAFALAYEDVKAFLNNQPSLIGELAKKYEWFGKGVKAIGDIFTDLGKAMDWLSTEDAGVLKDIAQTLLSLDGLETTALAIGALTLALSPLSRALLAFALAFWAAKAGLEYLSNLEENLGGPEKFATDNPRTKPGFVEADTTARDENGEVIYEDARGRRIDRPDERPTADFTENAIDYKLRLMQEEGERVEGDDRSPAETPTSGQDQVQGSPAETPTSDTQELSKVLEGAGSAIETTLNRASTLLENAATAPISSQTDKTVTQPITNNDITNTVNVGGVTVNTQAVDAAGVAAAVNGALKKQLQTTAAQLDDGVAK